MPSTETIDTNKDALLKEAADALETAQRHQDAIKLAFHLVELGRVPPYETYEAFHEKVASLLEKDLRVVEQALELDVDMPNLGKVAAEESGAVGSGFDHATAAFHHRLADD